jgi:3-hydroxyacyl-[acyl-carrier-protein] dehydratase
MSDEERGASEEVGSADIMRVMEMIPHRYPFLMVDKVVDIRKNIGATGIKNVSINEPFFLGHFPRQPVMPGVLIVESMAQTAAVLVVETLEGEAAGKLVYFMTVDEARFRKPVFPGDVLHVHVEKLRHRGNVWKFRSEAKVDDVRVAQATFSAMIMDE